MSSFGGWGYEFTRKPTKQKISGGNTVLSKKKEINKDSGFCRSVDFTVKDERSQVPM